MRFARQRPPAASRRAPPNLVVGNDAWKTFVADAMGTRPSSRTAKQKAAIEQALRGEDDLPEELRGMPARLAALEARIEADGDGVRCTMTARDWHLRVMQSPKECETVARRLNAAVEEAVADGHEIEVLVDRVRRDHADVGAMAGEVKAVMRHVAETVGRLRPSPEPKGTEMTPVTLRAVDLLSKYGFEDGAILNDILEGGGYDTTARPLDDTDTMAPGFGQAVLAECVRSRLAPGLTGFEISYDVSLGHNPVRLAAFRPQDGEVLRGYFSKVNADLSPEEVLSVAATLAPSFPEAKPDEVFGLDM